MRNVGRLRAAVVILPLLFSAGCQSLMEEVNDSLICVRNYSDSWHAWVYYRTNCPDDAWYPHHYGKGFRTGYRNVASGGNGCPPTLPPPCYWSVCYQNPTGQTKVQEWFRGYVFGANAARIDGVADYNQIMTSDRLFGRCGPQGSPADVHYTDHGSGWSSGGDQTSPTPASPANPPALPGAEVPAEPYFPDATPDAVLELTEPKALTPQPEVLELLQNPEGPALR